MKAEIICVGTELLLGDVVNTNAAYIAQQLAHNGIFCYHQSVIGDNPERLKASFNSALTRSDLIILTGGLGPTYDDLTKEIIADSLGLSLELHQPSMDRIEAYFKTTGKPMTENNIKQAMVPNNAIVFDNHCGIAPGIGIEMDDKTIILLPGPPREMRMMFETSINDYLLNKTDTALISHKLYLFGIGESAVEALLKDKMIDYQNPTIAPYAMQGSVMLRITATAETSEKAEALIKPVIKDIEQLFEPYLYGVDIENLEQVVVDALKRKKCTVATAESCTGGMVSSRITGVSGSSKVFELGVTTYSNEQKIKILDVPSHLFTTVGAVSEEVAAAMAIGVRTLAQADIGIGITGIAGPSGGTDMKPVGLVYIGIATSSGVDVRELKLGRGLANERSQIQQNATNHALKMILDKLK